MNDHHEEEAIRRQIDEDMERNGSSTDPRRIWSAYSMKLESREMTTCGIS
jgi:hypothetical protein